MKKLLIGGLLLAAGIFLSGCTLGQNKSTSFFADLKKRIGQSTTLQCKYPDEEGNIQTAYVKEKEKILKVDGVKTINGPGSILVRNDNFWVWSAEGNTGALLDLSASSSYSYKKITFNPQQLLEKIEYQKQNCYPTFVSDETFIPPDNITFSDFEVYAQSLAAD